MPKQTARRGGGRGGRGGGGGNNYRLSTPRNERESALDRLGKVIYPKSLNDKNPKKYKFISQAASSCIVSLPGSETRIKVVTKKFLKAYYEIFDQPGRTNLESLYNADAFFSFSSTYPMPTVGRNLLEVRQSEARLSMLIHEHTNIARALATFTPTEHLVNYLTVDVPYYMASPMAITCLQLVVTGVFKDTTLATDPLRAFTRIFVLKHTTTDKQGEPHYQIFNDMFMLQVPTAEQIKRYHQDAQAAKKLLSFQQQQQQHQANSSSNTSVAGTYTKSRREQQIESIMSRTSMNRAGSTKLLEDCSWDEEKSMDAFNKLYPQNKIPREFFIH